MNFLKLITILPLILQVIQLVEDIVQGAKKGNVKKEAALTLIENLLLLAQRTGTLNDIKFAEFKVLISETIDSIVDLLNKTGVFTKTG